ncbi:zinc-ribbon domain-containing protein [Methanobrevibacter sp.]|uniref:zinc-ribbon domain-containing protein n=1 Tax=Methanobrevibacter sp. TaxID=66852 RepID=UPI00386E10E3
MVKYCPSCGVELPDGANFCKSCGAKINSVPGAEYHQRPAHEESHTLAIVLGYIFAILIPLIGIIIGIYLLTRRNSSKASKHGKYILIVAVVIWFISFASSFLYMW